MIVIAAATLIAGYLYMNGTVTRIAEKTGLQ